jgi:hypothetical protein
MQTSVVTGYRWKTKDLERLPEEPFLGSATQVMLQQKRQPKNHLYAMCYEVSLINTALPV